LGGLGELPGGMPKTTLGGFSRTKSAMSSGRRRSSEKPGGRAVMMQLIEDDEDAAYGKFGLNAEPGMLMDRNERRKRRWIIFRSVRYLLRYVNVFKQLGRIAAQRRHDARIKRRAEGVQIHIEKRIEERRRLQTSYRASVAKARVGCDPWAIEGVSPEATDLATAASADADARSGPRFIFADGIRLACAPPQPRRLMSSRGVVSVHTEIRGEVEQRMREVCPKTAQPIRIICIFDSVTATRLRHVMAEFATAKCAREALVSCQRVSDEEGGQAGGANVWWSRCGAAWAPQLSLPPEPGDEAVAVPPPGEAGAAARPRSSPSSGRGPMRGGSIEGGVQAQPKQKPKLVRQVTGEDSVAKSARSQRQWFG